MLNLIWTIPAFPLLGFVLLSSAGKRMAAKTASAIGATTVGMSALISILALIAFLSKPESDKIFIQELGKWIDVPGFTANFGLYIDSLAMVFIFTVSFVGFLIHLYSIYFMKGEEGQARFFAWMNLFMASMLILVLADNLLLLYLGWEGVGLCSYLLIGFWYKNPDNGYAARKAFIITRIGDTLMAIGLFFLFRSFGTLNIHDILDSVSQEWALGSADAKIAAFLLLGGAIGKSAQLPLQTWLPDAMAGPSPVSALIHAATMVTAGVYLIARTHTIFSLAPGVMLFIAILGTLTLLMAGFSALVQKDIKRVLAWSTISQIGYMFLALGVGAWSAAIFHFFIHAFFKALLFLAAGIVIISLHHEHNLFRMGGLRKKMPLIFYVFIAGAASLSALPLITAGFFSKDQILVDVFFKSGSGKILWAGGLTGAILTALYSFRMVFLAFFGEVKTIAIKTKSPLFIIPLVILAVLSILAGYIEFGQWKGFSHFMNLSLPEYRVPEGGTLHFVLQSVAGLVALGGVFTAWYFYVYKPGLARRIRNSGLGSFLHNLWLKGWYFDKLYEMIFERPFQRLAYLNRKDIVDRFFMGFAQISDLFNRILLLSQTGRLRWYLAVLAGGLITGIIILAIL